MSEPDTPSGGDNFGELLKSIFDVLSQDPKIGLLAIAFAFLIFFAIYLATRMGRLGRVLVGGICTLCLFIVAVSAYAILLHSAVNGRGHMTIKLTSPVGAPAVLLRASTDKIYRHDAFTQDNVNVYDYDLLFEGRPATIYLSIIGRKKMPCVQAEVEDAPSAGDSIDDSKRETKFTIIMRKAYLSKDFDLELEYIDDVDYGPSRSRADKLVFTKWDGLDKNRIEVLSTHTENCVDAQLKYHEYASETPTDPTAPFASSFNLVMSAVAQPSGPDSTELLIKLLTLPSEDNYRALDGYFSRAGENTEEIASPIIAGPQYDGLTKSNLIKVLSRLPIEARPRSDTFVEAITKLLVDDNYDLRRSALEYLRSTDYVDASIADKAYEFLTTNLHDLTRRKISGRSFSAAYIGAVAVRDIFYNLGVREIAEFRQQAQATSPSEARHLLDNAVSHFEKGYSLRESFAPAEGNIILFEKMTYGKAIAAYAGAVSFDAFTRVTSAAEIPDKIIELAKDEQLVPRGNELATETIDWFQRFLGNIGDSEDTYAWPHHIVQAKQCTSKPDGLPYGCMDLKPTS